jgi:hypothetical protein
VTRLWTGRRWYDSRQGQGLFLFAVAWRLVLGPTQPPIQWVTRDVSSAVKRPGRKADHPPPCSAAIKNALSYTSASWHGA